MRGRILNRIKIWRNQIGYWFAAKTNQPSSDPLFASFDWIVQPEPLTGRDVCLLVSWSPEPRLSEHAIFLAKSWATHGFLVIIVVVKDVPSEFDGSQDLSFCGGVMVRENIGYDFAAWASAIRLLPDINQARSLVLANDSVFGPLSNFGSFIDILNRDQSDIVGTIGSLQNRPHIQSFLIMFKGKSLRHRAFVRFWNNVRNGDREWAIKNYELRLQDYFMSSGLSVSALYPAPKGLPSNTNPGLTMWRSLIEQGFPFVKVQLLRDNPMNTDLTGWQTCLSDHGYDPSIVQRYLDQSANRQERSLRQSQR